MHNIRCEINQILVASCFSSSLIFKLKTQSYFYFDCKNQCFGNIRTRKILNIDGEHQWWWPVNFRL